MSSLPVSAKESDQFGQLDPAQQELIYADLARNGVVDDGTPVSINFNNRGKAITGPMFASDEVRAPAAVGPLTQVAQAEPAAPVGALSAVAPTRRAPVDIGALLKSMMPTPDEDASSKWLALAAGLGKPLQTSSFGESLGNIAQAMQDHKSQQEKLRSQYLPLIMQKVAAQQAMEERAQLAAEAQQVSIQARNQQMEDTRKAQAFQADQNRLSREATSAAAIAARPAPAPHYVTTPGGVFAVGRDNKATPILDPATGKPLVDKEFAEANAAPTRSLGVPLPTVFPWDNQSSQKDKDKVRAAEIARGAKEIEADNDLARKEQSLANKAQQFLALNEKVETGGAMDKVAPGRWLNSFGSDYTTMQSITAELVPGMRAPGSGSSSDLDIKMFERATIGVDKPKPANKNIGQAVIQRAKQAQDYADFRNAYFEQNGTLQGANRYWAEYAKKNPIFDPNKTDSFGLNPARQDWREFFTAQQPDLAAAAAAELARRGQK